MKHNCPICGNSKFNNIIKIKKANKTLDYIECQNCGFVYNFPAPGQRWLHWFYSADNKSAKKFESNRAPITKEEYSLWQRRLNGIIKYKTKGKLLDIGCGKGILLNLSQNIGFKVYGTEYSAGEIKYCRDKFKLKNIYQGDQIIFKENGEKFDIVTLFHVLEHIIDFKKYLNQIKKHLNKDGILVIEVPNKDWLKRKSYSEELMSHQIHHNHFSADNLKVLLENNGFKILSFNFDNPFHVSFFNKWTILSLINKILFKFNYYNLSPVIKVYAEKR